MNIEPSDRAALLAALMQELGLAPGIASWIDGAPCTGQGDEVVLIDPYTNTELTRYCDAGEPLAGQACEAAATAQPGWANDLSAQARGLVMMEIARTVTGHAEPLARLEALVAGKPVRDCRLEVAKVVEMFTYYAGWADKLHGQVIPVPSGHLNYTLREPLGVVFQITPWNAPVFTAGWQIAPAIATGNTVVIKPSELTPVTTVALVKLAEQAGLPAGVVNVLCGLGATAAQAAIAHPAVRKVIFVGSPVTGRRVAVAAGQALKPVVLELGGKSANIVFDDARLEDACRSAQAAIFSATGQSCVAGSRLLVQRGVAARLQSLIAESMARIQLGDPLLDSTEMGPIGNRQQYKHVSTAVKQAQASGATVRAARCPEGEGLFVPPTILASLDNQSEAVQQELFGPVLTVQSFGDEPEAIAMANDSRFGLAGAVWTCDLGRAHRVAGAVRAGTFWINCYKAIHVASPFGGSLDSGFGRSSGTDALMEYTASKSVWVETAESSRLAFGHLPE